METVNGNTIGTSSKIKSLKYRNTEKNTIVIIKASIFFKNIYFVCFIFWLLSTNRYHF